MMDKELFFNQRHLLAFQDTVAKEITHYLNQLSLVSKAYADFLQRINNRLKNDFTDRF